MALDPAADIDRRSRAFERCFANRDEGGLIEAYYVRDELGPFASPPGKDIIRGHKALADMFRGQFEFASAIRLAMSEIIGCDDMVSELGRAVLTLRDGSEAFGRYIAIWLPTSDGWRVKMDVFTLDG